MNKDNKQVGYSSIIFSSFAISFFLLSLANIIWPIGNFKMTILSLVAVLFSVQQLLEAREEIGFQIANLEKKTAYQEDLIHIIDPSFEMTHQDDVIAIDSSKSRKIFALAMIILVIGLTLDFDFQNEAIANTSTIFSFAMIFATMAYKEHYSVVIIELNERLYKIDHKIIAKLKAQLRNLQSSQDEGKGVT